MNLSDSMVTSHNKESSLLERVTTTLDLKVVCQVFSDHIANADIFDAWLISLYDEKQSALICKSIKLPNGYEGVESIYKDFEFKTIVNDPIIHSWGKKRIIYTDKDSISLYDSTTQLRFDRWDMLEMVCIPLIKDHDNSFGVITAFNCKTKIKREKVDLLISESKILTNTLSNSHQMTLLRSREHLVAQSLREREQFLELITKLNQLDSTEQIYDVISHKILEIMKFNLAALVLYDDENNVLSVEQTAIIDEKYSAMKMKYDSFFFPIKHRPDPKEGATPTCFVQNARFYIPDVQQLQHLPMSETDKASMEVVSMRSILQVPIRHHGKPIGVMALITFNEVVDLNANELKMADLICGFIGSSIVNAQLYTTLESQRKELEEQQHEINNLNKSLTNKIAELDHLSRHDSLTKLYNFGALIEMLKRRTSELDRYNNYPLSIIICDIDHFKNFNDKNGHVMGNYCLEEIADRLVKYAREMDIACRYGGEEFVLILPQCNIESAVGVAERVRKGIADNPITIDENNFFVTASFGCAQWNEKDSVETLLSKADKALYAAKKSGRNVVISYEEMNSAQEDPA
ncbi:MAG: sensor domain-containing diguanylate cyclase [Gammaproteobacteria bacterium]|nr:MAG: sensor domain-containing diguanylate cyclase [Gammaproteobacteria bacterium]